MPPFDCEMAIEDAPATPKDRDVSKTEVHAKFDVVDDHSHEVSTKRQSLSDLFTIVSEPVSPL